MTSPENARLEERQHMLTAAIARALCFTGRCHMLDLCGKQRQCCAVMTSVDDVWLEAEALLIALPSTKIPSLTGQLSTDLASARAEIEQLTGENKAIDYLCDERFNEVAALRATVKVLREALDDTTETLDCLFDYDPMRGKNRKAPHAEGKYEAQIQRTIDRGRQVLAASADMEG